MIRELKDRTHRFLRWSEKYTKTDMVYLTEGGFWLTLKTILVGLVAFVTSIAFGNLLPQATYGEYKYVLSIFSFLAISTLLGMGTSVTRSIASSHDGTLLVALKTKIRWGLWGSLGALAIALYYTSNGNVRLGEAFVIVAVFLPFIDTLGIFNSILTGKHLFKVSTVYEVVLQALTSLVVISVLYFSDNLLYVLGSYFFSYTVVRFIMFRSAMRAYAQNTSVDQAAISYGKHLSLMEVLGTAADTIESMLIWQFAGPAPLAVYAFAKAIPLQITGALKRIPTLALPKFVRRDLPSIRKNILYRLSQMFLILVVIVGAYLIAAPYVYTTFFPQYTASIWYSQLFALTILTFPKSIIGTIFNAHGDKRALYINSTATPIINIALLVVLIPLYGIVGAVLSEIATQLFSLVLIATLFFYRTKI